MLKELRGGAPTGLAVLLVARRGEGPLDLDTRRRVFIAVSRYPGLSLARLAKATGVREDLVRYHLRVLEKADLVRSEEQGGNRRIYPLSSSAAGTVNPLSREQRDTLALLRRPNILRAVVALLQEEPLTAGELAEACGVSASTMTHHLKTMVEGELVHVQAKGRTRSVRLADREGTVHLLNQHPPPRDLLQGFLETWEGLGL